MTRRVSASRVDGKPELGRILEHYGVMFVDNMSAWQKVLCPVHDESRPSCTVNLDECQFHCHACGASGDVYDLVMIKENCDFPEAKRRVAELTGVAFDRDRPGRVSATGGAGYTPRFRRQGGGQRVASRPWLRG